MLKSMTGFGRTQSKVGKTNVSVLVRTLNSKQLDISLKTPFKYREREHQIRDLVSKKLLRGKIDVNILIEEKLDSEIQVDEILAKKYFKKLSSLSDNLKIKKPKNWLEILVKMPDVINSGNNLIEDEEWNELFLLVENACIEADKFRADEGFVLAKDLKTHLNLIEEQLSKVEKFDPERKTQMRERLLKDLKQANIDVQIDETRLEQELFYYIDKFDINEEKVRLKKHIKYFEDSLEDSNDEPIGKKLGFIAQEIGREINTIGSKSNHFEIQKCVVVMKDELEKIKEQLLNIL